MKQSNANIQYQKGEVVLDTITGKFIRLKKVYESTSSVSYMIAKDVEVQVGFARIKKAGWFRIVWENIKDSFVSEKAIPPIATIAGMMYLLLEANSYIPVGSIRTFVFFISFPFSFVVCYRYFYHAD